MGLGKKYALGEHIPCETNLGGKMGVRVSVVVGYLTPEEI
jgi:hypothetical protein